MITIFYLYKNSYFIIFVKITRDIVIQPDSNRNVDYDNTGYYIMFNLQYCRRNSSEIWMVTLIENLTCSHNNLYRCISPHNEFCIIIAVLKDWNTLKSLLLIINRHEINSLLQYVYSVVE